MTTTRTALIGLVAAGLLLPAGAGAKDGDIERAGSCTGASEAKIKLSPEDGRIEVEFEVDQNRNGVRWSVRLKRNGKRFARTHRTTRGPSGSFEIRRVIGDGAGADRVTARAKSPSGEVCKASATF